MKIKEFTIVVEILGRKSMKEIMGKKKVATR